MIQGLCIAKWEEMASGEMANGEQEKWLLSAGHFPAHHSPLKSAQSR